jgi:hypothetical protein
MRGEAAGVRREPGAPHPDEGHQQLVEPKGPLVHQAGIGTRAFGVDGRADARDLGGQCLGIGA